MLDQGEDAVQVDGHGAAPLRVRHLFDGRILRGPDPVIGHQDVQPPETFHGSRDQLLRRFRARQIAGHGRAIVRSEFLDQLLGWSFGLFVVEQHARSRRHKHADRRRTDAA